jgi:hypothetical protein
MTEKELTGWHKMLEGYPWYECEDCYPVAAYSEYMPPPYVGRKALGELDPLLFSGDDPLGWNISEIEEEFEIRPGLESTGRQILDNILRLGRGLPEHHIHGHNDENLKENPYWPPELASMAGKLAHERFVTMLPVMLSQTQDDKGRVSWTFFGRSILDPETAFWKNFLSASPVEKPEDLFISFISGILLNAYGVNCSDTSSLLRSGFRILSGYKSIPGWAQRFEAAPDPFPEETRYLLTFNPFSSLQPRIKEMYLSGRLCLIPFPGSLLFWGMQGYEKLRRQLPTAGQIPLVNLVLPGTGIGGLKTVQSGWFKEPGPGGDLSFNPRLLHEEFQRTHRWQRLHRYQDEINEAGSRARVVRALFSTDPEANGLYDKPVARNSHIWSREYELLLNGPQAAHEEIRQAEKKIVEGGLFGYRFFFPPMRAGMYDVYLHRMVSAYLTAGTDSIRIDAGSLKGYMTGYHKDDREMNSPVEMQPRYLRREPYLSALQDFRNAPEHYTHQTSLNIVSLLETWDRMGKKPLERTFARALLSTSKGKGLEEWLGELAAQPGTPDTGSKIRKALEEIIEPGDPAILPEAITFAATAGRGFEESWWNDIRCLAHGEFMNKDNADIATDKSTLSVIRYHERSLEKLGDYLIARHRKSITEAGMDGLAICGEMPFSWHTDFEFPVFDGWKRNQGGANNERNILLIIPGKNRKEAIVLGDHYDTAYMEDIFNREKGGSGARLSANGADDNCSATSTILQAAPLFLRLAKERRLERDIWLLHLTGEEFPSDCLGARNFCQAVVEGRVHLKSAGTVIDLSSTAITGIFIMDMIGHNRDNDRDIFQISPGTGAASLYLARQAHLANRIWNKNIDAWNEAQQRLLLGRGKRVTDPAGIPEPALFLRIDGEIRTRFNPHSSLFNTDGQIFSDAGIPVVLLMENYDINRSGYHDSKDTLENIDLDYGAALAAIAIETVARVAAEP